MVMGMRLGPAVATVSFEAPLEKSQTRRVQRGLRRPEHPNQVTDGGHGLRDGTVRSADGKVEGGEGQERHLAERQRRDGAMTPAELDVGGLVRRVRREGAGREGALHEGDEGGEQGWSGRKHGRIFDGVADELLPPGLAVTH